MTREELNNNWTLSEYNENTNDQLDYYINERACNKGDTAYLYSHENEKIIKMEIVEIIFRSDNIEYYDNFGENVLLDREVEYNADTSAEFITDNDCYLVWFKYML